MIQPAPTRTWQRYAAALIGGPIASFLFLIVIAFTVGDMMNGYIGLGVIVCCLAFFYLFYKTGWRTVSMVIYFFLFVLPFSTAFYFFREASLLPESERAPFIFAAFTSLVVLGILSKLIRSLMKGLAVFAR